MDIEKYIKEIKESIIKNEFNEKIGIILDKIDKVENSHYSVKPLIKIIQENPEFDFGNPGEIVFFLEKYDEEKYDRILVESVMEKPTEHTIFMMNRIINGALEEKKSEYIELYMKILCDNRINDELKKIIKEFLEFQKGNYMRENSDMEIYSNIVLKIQIENAKDLIAIKKYLGIEKSIVELTKETKKIPYIIVGKIKEDRAKIIIEKAGELKKYFKLETI
jgi:hypothetical protein